MKSRLAILAIVLALSVRAGQGQSFGAGESRAKVRLVRLLEEIPDSERIALGNVHDLRLRLEHGNILLLRRGGEFAAMLPIERSEGATDSLRYFYYVQHSPFLWLFPGGKDRGIATAAQGATIPIDSFRILWKPGGELGWVYFPDSTASRSVRFSVVSGRTVDEADPLDTKYWIELGPPDASGF